jgi:hypothetical protein
MMNRLADQRIAAEAARELGQVLIDPERESHPFDRQFERLGRNRARRRDGAEDHAVAGGLPDVHDDRPARDVQQPCQHAATRTHHPVATAASRQPVGPGRAHDDLERAQWPVPGGRRRGLRTWCGGR